jgi:hypothetical protein
MARRIKRLSIEALRIAGPSLSNQYVHLHFKDGRVLVAKPMQLEGAEWKFVDSFGHLLRIEPKMLYGADYEIKD